LKAIVQQVRKLKELFVTKNLKDLTIANIKLKGPLNVFELN
jgi:hypothetical protein